MKNPSGQPGQKNSNYDNVFHELLGKVSEDAGWVLQVVHDTRALTKNELEEALADARIKDLDSCLRELVALDLVVPLHDQWKATWTGAGVSNWRTQLLFADGKPVAEPQAGENGMQPGPECSEYRPALFSPYCWCRRALNEHSSEVVKAAQRLLRRR